MRSNGTAHSAGARDVLGYRAYGGVGFLHGRYRDLRFVPHCHEEYSVAVIMTGALVFRWAGRMHCAEASLISAINPGEIHTGQPGGDAGWEYLHFTIPSEVVTQWVPELGDRLMDISAPVISDPVAARALISAHQAAFADASELARDAHLAAALGGLFLRHAAQAPRAQKPAGRASTQLALDYIQAHFREPIRLKTLARHAGLSPYHFLRTFSHDAGLTPHAYQQQVRAAHALRQLKMGADVAEVANDAGYADQSHLTRELKRRFGITPGLLRAAV